MVDHYLGSSENGISLSTLSIQD